VAVVTLLVLFPTGARSGQAGEAAKPLQLGVLPNLSARVILQHYQPMREHLERQLGRAVEVVTAPDFKTFFARTQAGEYDVVVTAAHLARLAQLEAGYAPVLSYRPGIPALLITAAVRPIKSALDLRGAPVAFANPQSLVALRALHWLAEQGLRAGEFAMTQVPTEDSLGDMLLTGRATAAVLSGGEFKQLPEDQRARLVVFAVMAEVPSFTLLTGPKLGEREVGVLRAQLFAFPETADGRRFLAQTGFQGFREIGTGELRVLDPYLEETRRMLTGRR
jgi:phosphonate transport system substrate-binding protein